MADEKIDKAIQQLFKQSVKLVKLWENASPTSSFAAQKISIDLAGYDDIVTVFKASATGQNTKAEAGKKTALKDIINITSASTVFFASRSVSADDSGVQFGGCTGKTGTTGTPTTYNEYAIPAKIYGVKLIGGGYNLALKIRHFLCRRGRE